MVESTFESFGRTSFKESLFIIKDSFVTVALKTNSTKAGVRLGIGGCTLEELVGFRKSSLPTSMTTGMATT